jgi:hypothetical protein
MEIAVNIPNQVYFIRLKETYAFTTNYSLVTEVDSNSSVAVLDQQG